MRRWILVFRRWVILPILMGYHDKNTSRKFLVGGEDNQDTVLVIHDTASNLPFPLFLALKNGTFAYIRDWEDFIDFEGRVVVLDASELGSALGEN